MICKKCNTNIDDDSNFCEFCGDKIFINEINLTDLNTKATSMLVAGNLENELLHIKKEISSIKVNRLITRITTFLFFITEFVFYIGFISSIALLITSFIIPNEQIFNFFAIDISTITYNEGNEFLTRIKILKFFWFLFSLIILGTAIFFTAVRKQSSKVLKQDKVIKKIISSINNLIYFLKEKK